MSEAFSQRAVFNLRAFFLLLLGFVLSLYVAWMANASIGYGYSWLYGFYESKQHIERFAPQNKYRRGFEFTSEEEHKALFQNIVDSVHDDGKGLNHISYVYAGKTVPLLHEAEVIHLQDVAKLINSVHVFALAVLVTFLLLLYFQWVGVRRAGNLIDLRSQIIISALLIVMITLVFLVVGAKEIFYQLHIMIFPDDHQWFFYYQDSLMSTLMKAPDLFAGIAVQILLLGVVLFVVGLSIYKYLMPVSGEVLKS